MTERDEQGTGKHPHKSTEEPYPHHKGRGEESERSEQTSDGGRRHETRGEQESDSSDLKEREYRDAEGDVHHHTRTYEEQHGKEK